MAIYRGKIDCSERLGVFKVHYSCLVAYRLLLCIIFGRNCLAKNKVLRSNGIRKRVFRSCFFVSLFVFNYLT